MVIHLSILVLMILVSAFDSNRATYKKIRYPQYVMPKWPWMIVFGYLAILSALRSGMNDTSLYIWSFNNLPGTWDGFIGVWTGTGKDKGFDSLGNLFKMFISDNYHMWFLLFAAVESWCFVHTYRRESYSLSVVCYYFFASTLYYNYFSMMRQWLAVALLFAGFPFVYQKKWKQYFILCIIAAQFHNSAYLGIPFYFIVQGKPWQNKQNMILAGFAVGMVLLSPILNILGGAMEGTTYDYVIETMQSNSGSSPIRVLIAAVPVILSFVYKDRIAAQKSRALDICVNFTVMNFMLNVLAIFTSGLYVIRLATYFTPYVAILYSNLLEVTIPAKIRGTMKTLFYVIFFAFYWYQMGHQGAWGYNSEFLGRFSYSSLLSYSRY